MEIPGTISMKRRKNRRKIRLKLRSPTTITSKKQMSTIQKLCLDLKLRLKNIARSTQIRSNLKKRLVNCIKTGGKAATMLHSSLVESLETALNRPMQPCLETTSPWKIVITLTACILVTALHMRDTATSAG